MFDTQTDIDGRTTEMKKMKTVMLGSLLAAGLAAGAAAATYTGDSWYLQLDSSKSVMAPNAFGGKINGADWSGGGAGALYFKQVLNDTYTPQGGGNPFNETAGFLTYCTDISAHINWGVSYEFLPMTFVQAATTFPPAGVNPAWDWSDQYKGIYYAALVYNQMQGYTWAQGLDSTKTESSGAMQGAAQLAIWELLYDPTWSLVGGDFRVTSGDAVTRDLAQKMLDWVAANKALATYDQSWLQPLNRTFGTAGNDSYATGVNIFNEGAFQGMLYKEGGLRVPDGGLSIVLLGMALTGLGALSRRTRK